MLAGPAPGLRVGTEPWLLAAAGVVPALPGLPVSVPAAECPPGELVAALGPALALAAPGSMPIAHATAPSITSVRRCLRAGLDRPDTNASFTGAAGPEGRPPIGSAPARPSPG